MGERYWFRPKTFGYGATPINWQGWLLTLLSAFVSGGALLAGILSEVFHWPDRRPLQLACAFVFAAAQIVTIVIARARTDGDGRWRS